MKKIIAILLAVFLFSFSGFANNDKSESKDLITKINKKVQDQYLRVVKF